MFHIIGKIMSFDHPSPTPPPSNLQYWPRLLISSFYVNVHFVPNTHTFWYKYDQQGIAFTILPESFRRFHVSLTILFITHRLLKFFSHELLYKGSNFRDMKNMPCNAVTFPEEKMPRIRPTPSRLGYAIFVTWKIDRVARQFPFLNRRRMTL